MLGARRGPCAQCAIVPSLLPRAAPEAGVPGQVHTPARTASCLLRDGTAGCMSPERCCRNPRGLAFRCPVAMGSLEGNVLGREVTLSVNFCFRWKGRQIGISSQETLNLIKPSPSCTMFLTWSIFGLNYYLIYTSCVYSSFLYTLHLFFATLSDGRRTMRVTAGHG